MKKDLLKFLVLIAVAIGTGPASSAVWQWSKTASSNANADPTINWSEGMSPSSINDSARAQIARTADWRDDISGSLVTSGTSTAYTLSTNAAASGNGFCSNSTTLTDGQMLAFRAAATNGLSATLAVDSCSAYALQTVAGTAVPAGTLVAGTPYRVSYNLANTAWVIEGGQGNPYNIPLGGLMPYTGTSAPNSNFILPAGQCISTTTYAAYWALMGSPASGGCPGGQFAVLDLRGRVPAALDNLNGSAIGRMTVSSTGCGTAFTSVGAVCANGNESELLTTAMIPSHQHNVYLKDPSHSHPLTAGVPGGSGQQISQTSNSPASISATTGGASTGMTIGSVNGTANDNQTAATGGSGTHSKVMPVIGVTYLLRVI